MRLPVVDLRVLPEELDYLHVWRIDPTLPLRNRLEVRPIGSDAGAWVRHASGEEQRVPLDAEFAGELASAVQLLAARGHDATFDLDPTELTWVIELGWNGARQRFQVAHEPAEEALRAVVRRVGTLGPSPHELHVRRASNVVDGGARPRTAEARAREPRTTDG